MMNLQPVNRARQLTGVTDYALRKAIREGKIQVLKWGNRQLVDVDVVCEVLGKRKSPDQYWSAKELSEITGLRTSTIRKMAQEGLLPHEKIGNAYYFDKETILTDIAQRMAQDSQKE
ncbi:MAG: helix-turn-helix domain-containing protein [Clostridia bacterium]|nr:helix-turn-helix domain-containing protein [Clostridia bacterium]